MAKEKTITISEFNDFADGLISTIDQMKTKNPIGSKRFYEAIRKSTYTAIKFKMKFLADFYKANAPGPKWKECPRCHIFIDVSDAKGFVFCEECGKMVF